MASVAASPPVSSLPPSLHLGNTAEQALRTSATASRNQRCPATVHHTCRMDGSQRRERICRASHRPRPELTATKRLASGSRPSARAAARCSVATTRSPRQKCIYRLDSSRSAGTSRLILPGGDTSRRRRYDRRESWRQLAVPGAAVPGSTTARMAGLARLGPHPPARKRRLRQPEPGLKQPAGALGRR